MNDSDNERDSDKKRRKPKRQARKARKKKKHKDGYPHQLPLLLLPRQGSENRSAGKTAVLDRTASLVVAAVVQ